MNQVTITPTPTLEQRQAEIAQMQSELLTHLRGLSADQLMKAMEKIEQIRRLSIKAAVESLAQMWQKNYRP